MHWTDRNRRATPEIPRRRRIVVLMDGTDVARMMVERNVGVDATQTYELKRIDEDFFDE